MSVYGYYIEIAEYFNVSVDYLIGAINTLAPLERIGTTLPREFQQEWVGNLQVYSEFLVYYSTFSDEEKKFISKWSNIRKDKRKAFLKFINEIKGFSA